MFNQASVSGLIRILPPKPTLAKLLLIFTYFVGSVHFFTMINSGVAVDVEDLWPGTAFAKYLERYF
jgi:hypothetical protein